MAGRDGTGPMGQGPMTGRGMGLCTGARQANLSGYSFGAGRGFGRGMGLRRGFGRYYNDVGPLGYKTQKDFLADQKEFLKQRLDIINSQLEVLADDSE